MATLDLITLAELKGFLRPEDSSELSAEDTHLTALITAVSMAIEDYCRLPLIKQAQSETLDGDDGTDAIYLRAFPVDTAQTITVVESSTTLVQNTDYIVDPLIGRLRRIPGSDATSTRGWDQGLRNVVITYTAGRFANTAAVDERVKLAARILCKTVHENFGPALFGPQAADPIAKPAQWPWIVRQLLSKVEHPGGAAL